MRKGTRTSSEQSKSAAEPDLPLCSVEGCERSADYAVLLCDLYPAKVEGTSVLLHDVLLEQDFDCPYVCEDHAFENEARARGLPMPRGYMTYPFSSNCGQGFSLYVTVRNWMGWNGHSMPLIITPFRADYVVPPDPPPRCDWRPSSESEPKDDQCGSK